MTVGDLRPKKYLEPRLLFAQGHHRVELTLDKTRPTVSSIPVFEQKVRWMSRVRGAASIPASSIILWWLS